MATPKNTIPLGMFYGDSGGPAATPPISETQPNCPYLDPEQGAFCTLDGALCPFIGFNYRRCKKYMNNLNKGLATSGLINPAGATPKTGPPRLEALTEAARAKKRGPKGDAEDEVGSVMGDIPDNADAELEALQKSQTTKAKSTSTKSAPKSTDKKSAPKKTRKQRAPKKIKNPDRIKVDIGPGDVTPHSGASSAEAMGVVAVLDSVVNTSPGVKEHPDRLTHDQKQDLYHTVVAMTGQVEYDNPAALRDARVNTANTLAAVIKQELGVPWSVAKTYAADTAMVMHVAKGEGWGVQNPAEKALALAQATADKDSTVSLFINNPQAHKPSEPPPPVTPDQATPNVGQGPESHETPPTPGLGTAETPPGSQGRAGDPRRGRPGLGSVFRRRGSSAESTPRTPIVGDEVTYGMQTGTYMNFEQFNNYLEHVDRFHSEADKKLFFAGYTQAGKTPKQAIDAYRQEAEGFAKTKNYKAIAEMYKGLNAKVSNIDKIRQGATEFKEAYRENIETLKDVPVGDRVAFKQALRQFEMDPKNREKSATFLNKLSDKMYTLETKTLRIGDSEVQTFIRSVNFPTFSREDYEVMRMTQQAGLAAIQKQHQYGRGYGKWNTWGLFFRSVVAPLVLWWSGNYKLIQPLMRFWPQELLDQMYFAYVKKPLPKLQSADKADQSRSMIASRDSKFLASQKMARPASQERIMKDFDKDMPMPPDRAVMQSRWYPTTKSTWTKSKNAVLTQKFQELKTPSSKRATVRSFLRR